MADPATAVKPPPVRTRADRAMPKNPEQAVRESLAAVSFTEAIAGARTAMGARKLDRAKQLIEAATPVAHSQPEQMRLRSMRELEGHLTKFWDAVRSSLAKLEVAAELKINNTIVSVVEVSPQSISIRIEGVKRDYTVATMPVGLAMALAEEGLDSGAPESKLALGAFQAVDPNGDAADARRLWEEAALVGADIDVLLPALSEARIATVAGQKITVPSDEALSAGTARVRETLSAELDAAKTPAAKLQLAKKVLEMAPKTTDPVDRFALYRQAGELASYAGNIDMLMKIVDEMAGTFALDALEAKADALSKASEVATPASARSIGRRSLKLLDEALAAKRPAVAEQLNRITVAAVAKSGDRTVLKQIEKRNEQLQKLLQGG